MAEHELLGRRVGHIRVVEVLGEGGMGTLYVGVDEKLQRRVALKAVREGRLDAESRARFLREARVLSQLHHPNICGIHDYLESEGRDFLVLELIDGRNLREILRERPGPALQMRIARQLAGVLAATHAKGIVHRDLKPANVMVTRAGEVKVLDFGLARDDSASNETTLDRKQGEALAHSRDTSDAAVSRLGVLMGTLSYMSPEQARGEAVTTASDMYSYGLVVQEMFTGKPVYEPGLPADQQLARAQRGETLPVEGLDADVTALIQRLKDPAPAVRPSALDTAERLDWIAERPKRRLRRIAAWTAAAVLAAVAAGMSWQAHRIRQEAARANREAQAAKEVSEFLVKVFEVSDPNESRGNAVTARELLDKAGREIEGKLGDQPLIKARLLLTLARVYMELGIYDPALAFAEASTKLRAGALPPGDPALAESEFRWGEILRERGEMVPAAAHLTKALEICERDPRRNPLELADILNELANVHLEQEDHSAAQPLFQRAISIFEGASGAQPSSLAMALNGLGISYTRQMKYGLAEPLLRRAIAILEAARGGDDVRVATASGNLATALMAQSRFAEAEPLLERAMAIDEKGRGADHPSFVVDLHNLASLKREMGKYDEAEALWRRALDIMERTHGPDHFRIGVLSWGLGVLRFDQGRYAEAEPLYQRALAAREKTFGPDHPEVARALRGMGVLQAVVGNPAGAVPLLERALAIREKTSGAQSLDAAAVCVDLAGVLPAVGRGGEAPALLTRALAAFDKSASEQMRSSVKVQHARALLLKRQPHEARRLAEQVVATGYRSREIAMLSHDLGLSAPPLPAPRTK